MSWFKTKFINDDKLPLVIEPTDPHIPTDQFLDLAASNKKQFQDFILSYGGVLFRGFPLHHHDHFAALIKNLGTGKFLDYIGGDSPRNKITDGIYTSTEAPPSIKIPLHNELSFVKYHPKHIYFFCEYPSPEGGETIVADARKVYDSIDPSVKKRFIEKSLKYVSCYYYQSKVMELLNQLQPSHKSWIQVFETEDKREVEKKCRENEFGFKWNHDDWLQIQQIRPAISQHPKTKETVWFNQAHLFDFNPRLLGWSRYIGAKLFYYRPYTRLHEVFFADGTQIPREDIYHILDMLNKNTIAFPWEKGDVLALDNILAMHGRNTFTGKRRILAAMTG